MSNPLAAPTAPGSTSRPRILLLADRPGWAYDAAARAIAGELADEFECRVAYVAERPDLSAWTFDLVHVFFWGETYHQRWVRDPRRVVKEISSHRWANEAQYGCLDAATFAARHLADAVTLTATSERLQALVAPHREVLLVPNGVDPARFADRGARRGALRIGWAGNAADACKGLRDVIVPAAGTEFELLVAGGDLSPDEMAAFYNAVDVLCVASTAEGEPLTLIEGMASGCFPVCVDVGIVPELVSDGANGLVVERTPAAFRHAFQWCAANLALVRAAGAHNARELAAGCSWSAVAPAWRGAWRQALAGLAADGPNAGAPAVPEWGALPDESPAGALVVGWVEADGAHGAVHGDLLAAAAGAEFALRRAPRAADAGARARFLDAVDVLCVADEADGALAREAVARGCWTVAADEPALAAVVRHRTNGLMVAPTADAFRAAFQWCAVNVGELRATRAAGRSGGDAAVPAAVARPLDALLRTVAPPTRLRDVIGDLAEAVVIGTGARARGAAALLRYNGVRVAAFCAERRDETERAIDGVPVLPLTRLPSLPGVARVVATDDPDRTASLLAYAGDHRWVLYDDVDFVHIAHPNWVGHFDRALLDRNAHAIAELHDALADPFSRSTLLSLVHYRRTLDPRAVPCSPVPEYFHPEVEPAAGDVIVDGGAWEGDTPAEFAAALGNRCTVHAFEPVPASFGKLVALVRERGLGQVVVAHQLGLWHSPGRVGLDTATESTLGCHLDPASPNQVPVTSVDELVRSTGTRVDLIKLDVEGAEREALEGARETIRRFRPKLHVCVYHKPGDLWELPLLVRRLDPGYRLHLLHHRVGKVYGTILYATAR